MMHADIATGESAVGKELRGCHRALQAVGINVNAAGRWAAFLRQNAGLLEPGVKIVAHIDFQYPALGGQQATRRIPGRPGFRRGLCQHAAVIGQRRTQVMATHHQHLIQLIVVGFCQGSPGD
ncbi:hypothetical protein D3C80_1248010 [compost metagenome]